MAIHSPRLMALPVSIHGAIAATSRMPRGSATTALCAPRSTTRSGAPHRPSWEWGWGTKLRHVHLVHRIPWDLRSMQWRRRPHHSPVADHRHYTPVPPSMSIRLIAHACLDAAGSVHVRRRPRSSSPLPVAASLWPGPTHIARAITDVDRLRRNARFQRPNSLSHAPGAGSAGHLVAGR